MLGPVDWGSSAHFKNQNPFSFGCISTQFDWLIELPYKPIKFRVNLTERENGFLVFEVVVALCKQHNAPTRPHKTTTTKPKKITNSNFLNHNSRHLTSRSPGLTNSVGRGSALAPSTTKRYLSTGRYLHPALIVFLG